jgi:hypothetical protein
MKLTVCLSASLVALLAMPGGLRGAAPADGPVNPYANVDPDGVPLAVTQGDDDKFTSKQAETLEKQQADQEYRARNWLLLEYEQQFRHNNAQATTPDRTLNMYLQLSMNRDLAAVSNDSSDRVSNPTPPPSLHATPKSTSAQNSISLRPDSTLGKSNFTPLISPFNSSFASSASQPYYTGAYSSALPSSLAPGSSLGATQAPAPAPAPAHRPSPTALPTSPADTVDMQTPGMIADKSNPLPGMPSLNLDSLPDPTAPDAQNQQQSQDLPELRQPLDAGLLHHEMTAKLAPAQPTQATAPGQKNTLPTPATPPAPPPPETPEPISKQPQLSPVHAPLTSPLDMFNH